jgi:hypothetical protein
MPNSQEELHKNRRNVLAMGTVALLAVVAAAVPSVRHGVADTAESLAHAGGDLTAHGTSRQEAVQQINSGSTITQSQLDKMKQP